MDSPYLEHMRHKMVAEQIERRGIRHPALLEAMRRIPRHLFIPEPLWDEAYDDKALPIGAGQTISQPYIVAIMTSLLGLNGEESVLEVGTGSGYQAAILAQLTRHVYTIERHEDLAAAARLRLWSLGIENVSIHVGDGALGWAQHAPYDGILVTCAAPAVPPPLAEQLGEGGRMALPVGPRGRQVLQRWERHGPRLEREDIIPVAFVPLLGEHGWREEDWE